MGLDQINKRYQEYLVKREKLERLIARPGYASEGNTAKELLKTLNNKIAKYESDHPELSSVAGDTESAFVHSREGNHDNRFVNSMTNGDISTKEYYPKRDHDAAFVPRYGRTSGYKHDALCTYTGITNEDKLYRRLGIIYVIFDTEFKINIRGHVYRVCFKELVDDPLECAFCRVKCDIFEDDLVISSDVVIGFCPFFEGDAINNVRDMEISAYSNYSIKKYASDCCRYKEIMFFMQLEWNRYFSPKELPWESSKALDDAKSGNVSPSSSSKQYDPAVQFFGLPEPASTNGQLFDALTRRRVFDPLSSQHGIEGFKNQRKFWY